MGQGQILNSVCPLVKLKIKNKPTNFLDTIFLNLVKYNWNFMQKSKN